MGLIDKLFANTKVGLWINHRNFYLLGFAIILSGLGWSQALMSIGQFVLLGNWILELNFKSRAKTVFQSKLIGPLVLIFLLHLIGLVWTENVDYGLKDIRIKLPLLALPIIIGTTRPLSSSEWKGLLKVYFASLFILTMISLGKLLGFSEQPILDKRELSIYISHIRYGLNIALATLLLLNRKHLFRPYGLQIGLGIWFLVTLFLFELFTGLFCFIIISTIYYLVVLYQSKAKLVYKLLLPVSIAAGGLVVCIWIQKVYQDYKKPVQFEYNQSNPIKETVNGNPYSHAMENQLKTNGVYLWRYISWEEMRTEWAKRSDFDIRGKDKKGQHLEPTLVRYLSSKGLTKDSLGISRLSKKDIKAVESGIANYYYLDQNPIENRLHKTFFELDMYFQSGYPNGYSLAMRLEYWKTAWHIIQNNFWKGVGTGDIKDAFQTQYDLDQSRLDPQYRRRAHNQYLAIWVAFGVIGLMVFLFFLIYPLFHLPKRNRKLYLAFFGISCLSFLTEDTLETQAGVTFFALFNSLFLLGLRNQDQTSW